MKDAAEFIELRATNPDADLACDFTIATEKARDGLPEALRAGMIPPLCRVPGGIEVRFSAGSWDAVRRYVELESRCCSFLNLSVSRTDDAVLLRVTGRPEAQALIAELFASSP